VTCLTEGDCEKDEDSEEAARVSSRFVTVLFFGLALVVVGLVLVVFSVMLNGGSASFSGIIFIGPFPIVIGAGPDAAWLILTSILLCLVGAVVFVLMRKKS
jgi:uncharacterized membrane protein